MQLILATSNKDKVREVRDMLAGEDVRVLTMKDAGFTGEIEETGTTFAENARLKAGAVAAHFPESVVLADDSGLEIAALNGAPGIYSSRYLGEDTPYAEKNRVLLERLQGVPEQERTARFVCAMAAVLPDGEEIVTEGIFEGRIAEALSGANGFGYDPVFFVPEKQCTAAALSEKEKNAMSHRGKALRAMLRRLRESRVWKF